ncbi:MAG: tRNA nucleotidyltransferase, CC-adding [Candidatus Moranbacteria bacterium GW2011_GWC2_37_8]|nr:MAG: tRNA nucleotidyltransferase, CC-adding [Candidatus Moranbacteria bacterium GW2011_GWC2_37_8]KKQ62267.1 MAG: tRNA nucleotidyltransferase, CC-adding [Parcubacteria group bacterium GW2011_GWC1_38_22]KKQ79433.1 MAG: tRNA nucleotidyltransferase, CC-adding [Candidatus Moranbacteria bacterium GW2011_GWD2_38_7]
MLTIKEITIDKLKSGKLKKDFPEFYELKRVIENNPWHNNESTFTHTLNVLKDLEKFLRNNKNTKLKKYLNQSVDGYKRKDLLFLATVFHDLGKKETIIKNGKLSSFPEHEKISILKSKNILKDFDLSKKEREIVLGIIKYHSDLHSIVDEDNENLKKQFDKLMKSSKDFFAELIIMVMADTAGSYLKKTAPARYDFRMNFYKEALKK